jgi:hypothetical protein
MAPPTGGYLRSPQSPPRGGTHTTLGRPRTTGQVLEFLDQLLRRVLAGLSVISHRIDGTDQAGHGMGKGGVGCFDLVSLFALSPPFHIDYEHTG